MKGEIFEEQNQESSSEEMIMPAEDRVYNYILENHPFADNFFTAQELWDKVSKMQNFSDIAPSGLTAILKDLSADGYLTRDEEKDRYCERPQSEPSEETIRKFGRRA